MLLFDNLSTVLNYNTPHTILQNLFPNTILITSLPFKIFGCIAFVHNHHRNRNKLDRTSIPCIFLGYSTNHKGYKCYSPSTNKFYHFVDVALFENQPFHPKTKIHGEKNDEFQLKTVIHLKRNSIPPIKTMNQTCRTYL